MKVSLVLLPACLLLAACTSPGPKDADPTFYLLRSEARAPDGLRNPPVEVGLNRVTIADYLGQQGIVVATAGDRIRPARKHLWAESLDSSIRLFLQDAISVELGYPVSADVGRRRAWRFIVDVHIDQWHGSLDGEARIVATWVLIDVTKDQIVSRHRFEQTGALKADGYDALVAAQTDLLDALASAVAESMEVIGRPPGAS
jgi:uncharacterized lipoprotein YmbA